MHKILLADDEPDLLSNLKKGLAKIHPDWTITAVSTASDAIKQIQEVNYDLVITDWLFGKEKLTGTDVLKVARENDALTMGIVISAYQGESMDRYRDGFAYGAYDVIDKTNATIDFAKEVELKAAAAMTLRDATLTRSRIARHLDRNVVEAYNTPEALKFGKRWLTIVFCDVRGFSKINKELMAEDKLMATFLKKVFTKVIEVTNRWGGIVDKFMGDGAMLLFGAATSASHKQAEQESDACNAVHAALELQAEMEPIIAQFEKEFSSVSAAVWEGLELGIGIHSADVLVGLIETKHRDQFTALGHGVNLAQRFESAAGRVVGKEGRRRGNILVSNPVKARIGNRFNLKDEGVLTDMRNVDGQQSAWSVESVAVPILEDEN